jgi:hypothetical protein
MNNITRASLISTILLSSQYALAANAAQLSESGLIKLNFEPNKTQASVETVIEARQMVNSITVSPKCGDPKIRITRAACN